MKLIVTVEVSHLPKERRENRIKEVEEELSKIFDKTQFVVLADDVRIDCVDI